MGEKPVLSLVRQNAQIHASQDYQVGPMPPARGDRRRKLLVLVDESEPEEG
ncbi:hypothetical protein AA0535_1725 [Asaia krungthepensis NRIC 0535]|uniref:Uncharacterized protein n=1 Tax=Asaia krungthepensis NRIC 0535 TaxID=1307925 RepID=A0ABQ0Q398_9PROT|nr:hypothetical protein AA0535_1725 [Asaia krungthepensis NRIC 0535]